MSIYVTLVKHIRKDNNDYISELDNRYMNVELLIPPEAKTALVLKNKTKFFVSGTIQDLHERRVIVFEFVDICHRKFWDDDFYPDYLQKLRVEGWLNNMPRGTLPRI